MIKKPTWLYQPVNIDNLDLYVNELQSIVKDFISDVDSLTPDFVYIQKHKVIDKLPECCRLLESLNLLDRWKYLAFITGNQGKSLPVHVDSLTFETRAYGLNLPVLNCKDSFTVFYSTEQPHEDPLFNDPQDPRYSAITFDEKYATEIDRVEATNPCWINVSMPHKPVINHNLARILASFRFSPEVHDIFES